MLEDVKSMQKIVDVAMYQPQYSYPMLGNFPRPKVPEFASVKLCREHNPGFDETTLRDNGNGSFTNITEGVRLLIFEVLFTEGDEATSRFTSSFYRQDVQDMMVSQDLSILDHAPITNKTLTLETNWEIRSGVLVECLARRVYEHDVTVLAGAEIDFEVNTPEGLITDTIETT